MSVRITQPHLRHGSTGPATRTHRAILLVRGHPGRPLHVRDGRSGHVEGAVGRALWPLAEALVPHHSRRYCPPIILPRRVHEPFPIESTHRSAMSAMEAIAVAGAGGWFNDFVLLREVYAKRPEQFIENKEHECPTWSEGEAGGTPVKRPGREKSDHKDYKDWPLVSKILL